MKSDNTARTPADSEGGAGTVCQEVGCIPVWGLNRKNGREDRGLSGAGRHNPWVEPTHGVVPTNW